MIFDNLDKAQLIDISLLISWAKERFQNRIKDFKKVDKLVNKQQSSKMKIAQLLLQMPGKIENMIKSEEIKQRNKLLQQFNQFRKKPETMIPYLKERKQCYSNDQSRLTLFSPYFPQKGIKTEQGASLIPQLMGQLYARDKMPQVVQNQFLTLISQQIAQNFKQSKDVSQIKITQSMGKYLRNQLNNCSDYNFVDKITCLIGVGFDKTRYETILMLLIDDGNKQRKNRYLMLNSNWRFIGIGTTLMKNKPQLRITVYLLTENILKK